MLIFRSKRFDLIILKILNFFIKVIFNCVFMLEFIHLSISDLFCNIYHKTNSRLFLYLFCLFIFFIDDVEISL